MCSFGREMCNLPKSRIFRGVKRRDGSCENVQFHRENTQFFLIGPPNAALTSHSALRARSAAVIVPSSR